MAKAIIARTSGDDYQARFFWFQVCRMFLPYTRVVRVSYELDEIKSLDDVVVYYDPPVPDGRGGLTSTDYFQVKFHVTQNSAIKWRSLMDPQFIGAVSFSFLQRVKRAQEQVRRTDRGCRFFLVTPWIIDPEDLLGKLVSNNGGELRLDRLFDGSGPRSQVGRIRVAWAAHLEVEEKELREILTPLRIQAGCGSLSDLNDRLNTNLCLAGLKPVPESSIENQYDDLARKFVQLGKTTFVADEIKEIARREGLWVGVSSPRDDSVDIGIRSFIHYAEYMEDETDHMLDLVQYFPSGRKIRDHILWDQTVTQEVADFLGKFCNKSVDYRFHLDTHVSVALLAGYFLGTKVGATVSIVQKSVSGRVTWGLKTELETKSPMWNVSKLEKDPTMQDIVVSVSITHDIKLDVETYLSKSNLPTRGIIFFTIKEGPSSTAIKDGAHALKLIQELVAEIRRYRTPRTDTIHLFIAGPNGFAFFFGQHAKGLGRCVVYEYDFESGLVGAYEPSITLPPASKSLKED